MFTGRPMPAPGEPLFLPEDTDAAVALAEEERDACPSCRMPKAICRHLDNQMAFEPVLDVCWATKRAEERREELDKQTNKARSTKAATLMSTRFRDGYEPDLLAGLDLGGQDDEHDAQES